MATGSISLGPTGETVASNIRRIRNHRRLRLDDVADLTSYHGRRMSKATLSQIENGQRRVDVDDLMVLARVLKVTPIALLVPPSLPESSTSVEISGFGWRAREAVVEWIEGGTPLEYPDAPAGVSDDDWWTWYQVEEGRIATADDSEAIGHRKPADG